MYANEKKIYTLFLFWLIISLILVFLIIIVGGLTRLTDSGLSITEWELFSGLLPPINNDSWNLYFNEYKKIPQYKLLNFNMTIEEFKIIFYWEYFHRILARLIGLFFLIPLIYFYLTRKIKYEYIKVCFLVLALIVSQGIIGWFMVKSGLVNDVTVSHYRLALHLMTAVFIISIIFWLTMNVRKKRNVNFFSFSIKNLPFKILILLIYVQIIMGAFVSGLDAGKIYQTWPMMGNTFFPNDIMFKDLIVFENHSTIQFYHRILAYIILLYVLFLGTFIYQKKLSYLYSPLLILIFFILLQALLGIFTLLSGLNIYLASAHQIVGVLLVFSALNLYYFRTK
jgi:cytochrome c oxidase assembly protein subunit 15